MRRRAQRAVMIAASACVLAGAAALAAVGLRDSVTYFRSPTEIVEKRLNQPGERVRLGGLVAQGSVSRSEDGLARFVVTDGLNVVGVTTDAILPDLFAEGQGVVAEGVFDFHGDLRATRVLARHDENYMPAEAYEALRRAARYASPASGSSLRYRSDRNTMQ